LGKIYSKIKNMKNWEIYLIDFPFTDGIWFKKRPCLIIWIDKEDIEVLFITTKNLENTFLIQITDFEKGWLKKEFLFYVYKQILISYSKINFDNKTINCIEKCINS